MNVYTKEYLICPWCGEHSKCQVDHLYSEPHFPVSFGPWYCEVCGRGIDGKVNAPHDVTVWKSKLERSWTRQMVLLRFDGKDCPVFFVMEHNRYHGEERSLSLIHI